MRLATEQTAVTGIVKIATTPLVRTILYINQTLTLHNKIRRIIL